MKILITGGLGFIGSNLARRLVNENHDVTIVDSLIPEYGGNYFNVEDIKDKLNINITDLRDQYSIRHLLKGKEIIFNLAAQTGHTESMKKPFEDLEINSLAQLKLLENVKDVCPEAVVVYASTRQLYGKPKYLPVDEKHPIRPVDINGINKLSGENFHLLFNDVYKIKTSVLRLTNTYGPGMRIKDARQIFLGIWIKNILTNQPFLVYGDGKQVRDFNYVDDVVDALIRASTKSEAFGQVMNLGSNQIINLESLANKLINLYPNSTWEKIPFPEFRKSIDIGDYYSNYKKSEKILSWEPKVGLEEGLQKTINFYEKNIEYYL